MHTVARPSLCEGAWLARLIVSLAIGGSIYTPSLSQMPGANSIYISNKPDQAHPSLLASHPPVHFHVAVRGSALLV